MRLDEAICIPILIRILRKVNGWLFEVSVVVGR